MSQEDLDTTQSAGSEDDLYNLSDDDFMNLDPSQYTSTYDEQDLVEEDDDGQENDPADEADDADDQDVDDEEDNDEDTAKESVDADTDTDEDDVKDDFDAAAEYQKILAPFKANGKDLQVKNAEEAITLMQQGANYNKKMAALKPHLKTLKILENNGLLTDEKIGFLIDLSNKDQKAISKLLKDSGLDPLDVDVEASSDYTPSKHSVSDQELALDEVLDEIQDSPHYGKTVDLVTKQWDETSKRNVAQTPQLLKVINDHMANGVYDVISTEMDRMRVLGQLNSLSDLDAYKQVGDSIQQRGGFDHLFTEQGQQKTPPAKRLTPKQKPGDPKLNEKRRAAGNAKGTPARQKNPSEFNPLSLSDEEFEKQFNSKLL